ncbi:hypothetical protein RYX36_009309 [Vicia faba]
MANTYPHESAKLLGILAVHGQSKGPFWAVPLGRRDSTTANESEANNLPSPFEPLENITAKFVSKGLEKKDVAVLSEYGQEFRAAVQEERAATTRDLLKSKRQEMDSVQSTMNRLNNTISVGDIDSKIYNLVSN